MIDPPIDLTLGQYIELRMQEENMTAEDLDADTIDFFYQQWLVDPTGARKKDFYG